MTCRVRWVREPNADHLPAVAALTWLSVAYARAIDTRDFEGLRALFEPDTTIVHNHADGEHGSFEPRLAGARRVQELSLTQRYFTNHDFTVDGDRAAGWFSMSAQHARTGGPGHLLAGGIYGDTYRHGGRQLADRRPAQ